MRTDLTLLTPFQWELARSGPDTVTAVVNPESAGFAGHFPGRPMVPGVCLIDLVCQAAVLVASPGVGAQASLAVKRAHFAAPVLGGDVLTVTITRSAPSKDAADGLLGVVYRDHNPVSRVQLGPTGAQP